MFPFIKEETRIYALDSSGELVAEITFPMIKPGVYCMDHTFVDPSPRGQGIAEQLVQAALEQIQKNGGSPTATCTYAAAWLKKHPQQTETAAL